MAAVDCAMMRMMDAQRPIINAVFAGFMTVAALSAWADAPVPTSAPPVAAATATENSPAAPPTVASATPGPSNQIWECTTKGLRTFSNNPCGANSTVRQLNPINVMEPQPTYHVTHTYAPAVTPAPVRNYDAAPASENADETYTENAYNGYPGYVVVTRAHRVRPNNAHNHPHPHHP
jgi:hypothetical protein